MDVWSAVQWWDEWQLRILVLGSLGIQWFLLLAAPMRKYTVPQCFRTFIWLAYISSDALAIYALATLFNRHASATPTATTIGGGDYYCSSRCSCIVANASILEVLWAPVLLIHLGGQREMSAYTIEDNELWTRHTVTLVSQVTVAIYAFYKSWPATGGDSRLLASAILLFIIGVLSFSEKPWAFRRASINRLAAVSSLVEGTRPKPSWWEFCFTELDKEKKAVSNKMRRFWKKEKQPQKVMEMATSKQEQAILTERDKVHMILSDMSLLAADSDLKNKCRCRRRRQQQQQQQQQQQAEAEQTSLQGQVQQEMKPDDDDFALGPISPIAEKGSQRWLRKAFGLIYTRANVVWTPAYLAYHLLLVPSLHITAIALFATSNKRQYNAIDVKATYVLLCFTAALDILAEPIRQLLFQLMSMAGVPALCETVPQYSNLIESALRRTKPVGLLLKCVEHVGCNEGSLVCKRRKNMHDKVAGLLFLDMVAAKSIDLASYRNFARGCHNWALNEHLRDKCGQEVRRTLRGSFDRGVLLWHIATDLCILPPVPYTYIPTTKEFLECTKAISNDIDRKYLDCTEAISDYMAHLLNLRPDMLMTGSRQHLFSQAMGELESILKHLEHPHRLSPGDLMKRIMEKAEDDEEYPLVHDACNLARELMCIEDPGTRCEVMYRVWVGMLFYSASMCRGYLHAKSLGEGGEFLSSVWLILSLKGTKTLADKLQMPEPEPGEQAQPAGSISDVDEDLSFLL